MKKIYSFFLTLTIVNNLFAQTWSNFNKNEGLGDNLVCDIVVDSLNNKWFATSYGVSKFNNISWITYTTADGLASNRISTIASDKKGYIWVGSGNIFGIEPSYGVSKFDGNNWKIYTSTDGLASNVVNKIAIDFQNVKWFLTNAGISKFNDTTWVTYNKFVTCLTIDAQNNKWFGTSSGILKYDGLNWTNILLPDCEGNNLNVLAIASDTNNNIWATTKNGVSKFDGKSWTNYNTTNAQACNGYSFVTIDKNDNKWFVGSIISNGPLFGWASKFDNINWINYTKNDGLSGNIVYAIAEDNDGNKWFATDSGVSRFTDKGFSLTVSPSTLLLDESQNSIDTVKIFSNYPWKITNFPEWVSINKTTGLKDDSIIINTKIYNGYDMKKYGRRAQISISNDMGLSQSLIIIQTHIALLSINHDTIKLNANKDSSNFTIYCDQYVNPKLHTDQTWFTINCIQKPFTYHDPTHVTTYCNVITTANSSDKERKAIITVSGDLYAKPKTVTLVQAGNNSTFLNEHYAENDILVYPNPVSGKVYINFSQPASRSHISIYSINGINLYKYDNNKTNLEINLEKYRPGCYYIKISTPIGEITKKIIKIL